MSDSSENPKAEATDLATRILEDYVVMNRAALIHTSFADYLATLEDNVCISVAEIKGKLKELEVVARDRLKVLENLYTKVGG